MPARAVIALVAALLAGLMPAGARADPTVLRMAAVAPDGTPWARELRSFSRDVETQTHGEVQIKWYLGGIAGDELAALERMRHGQLDGLAGSSFCERLAPSMRVVSIVGLFQSRDEVGAVLAALGPTLAREFRHEGVIDLAETIFGADILFSRHPVANMADFRSTRWWIWNGSPVYQATFPLLGVASEAASLEQAAADFANHKSDGFVALPSAALAFQWSTLASYFTVLNMAMVPGCMVLTNVAMDPLTVEQQQAVRSAAAKFKIRWNDISAALDQSLVEQLFEKQGLKRVRVPTQFRAEFFDAARAARENLGDRLVPHELLSRVLIILADYRVEHPGGGIAR
jgi:TRAP-type C4-dicarboxylate transport system substrate-binding protein